MGDIGAEAVLPGGTLVCPPPPVGISSPMELLQAPYGDSCVLPCRGGVCIDGFVLLVIGTLWSPLAALEARARLVDQITPVYVSPLMLIGRYGHFYLLRLAGRGRK